MFLKKKCNENPTRLLYVYEKPKKERMIQMKKIISLLLVFAILTVLCVSAAAATPPSVDLLWENIQNIDNSLLIYGEQSIAESFIYAEPDTVRIQATLTVYRLVGTEWYYVNATPKTVTTDFMYISVPFKAVSNSSYKSILVVYVTNSDGYTETFQRAKYANS